MSNLILNPSLIKRTRKVKCVIISDTHSNSLEEILKGYSGDILIHCGDFSNMGSIKEIKYFNDQLGKIRHKFKNVIVIAGNHDLGMQGGLDYLITNALYLQDSMVTIQGLKIYGSPWVPYINGYFAFELKSEEHAKEVWSKIPKDLDILVTHCGPSQILSYKYGCSVLKSEVMFKKKPKIHCFGHVHAAHGSEKRFDTKFYNAAICDSINEPVNKPTVIEV